MTVRRGEIYYADLSPVVGSEQGGVRPVLIVQNDVGNRFSPTVIAAAITSQHDKADLPTHIEVDAQGSGLVKDSVILLEQVRTLDKHRAAGKDGQAGPGLYGPGGPCPLHQLRLGAYIAPRPRPAPGNRRRGIFVRKTVAFPGQICYTGSITRERSRGYDCSYRESQRVKTGYRYTGRQRPGYHSRPFCDTILLWHTQKGVYFLCPKPAGPPVAACFLYKKGRLAQ